MCIEFNAHIAIWSYKIIFQCVVWVKKQPLTAVAHKEDSTPGLLHPRQWIKFLTKETINDIPSNFQECTCTRICAQCLVHKLWQLPFSLQTMTTTAVIGSLFKLQEGDKWYWGLWRGKELCWNFHGLEFTRIAIGTKANYSNSSCFSFCCNVSIASTPHWTWFYFANVCSHSHRQCSYTKVPADFISPRILHPHILRSSLSVNHMHVLTPHLFHAAVMHGICSLLN